MAARATRSVPNESKWMARRSRARSMVAQFQTGVPANNPEFAPIVSRRSLATALAKIQ